MKKQMNLRHLAFTSAAYLLALTLTGCAVGDVSLGGGAVAAAPTSAQDTGPELKPLASMAGGVITSGLSPAAIRQQYGLTNLNTPAQQGAGQIIAIIGAYNNPNAAADLNKFSAMHGLPQCRVVQSNVQRAASGYYEVTNVPKASAGDTCEFQIINLDSFGRAAGRVVNGKVQEMVYGNDRIWAAETTMDIQWAHAIAPLAKIVLIQVASPFPGALSFGVQYASKFANVVNMSWGQFETGFEVPCSAAKLRVDPTCTPTKMAIEALTKPPSNGSAGGWDTIAFSNPNVTYVAASGDWGAKPMWPSSSDKVVAVGGTRIFGGGGEMGWSGSGGGVSRFYASPRWQKALGAKRTVPDLSMVASPESAVSVYITPSPMQPDAQCVAKKGAAACGWYRGYGTSVAAPMVAGMVAIANAVRAEQNKAPLHFTAGLYAAASIPGQYAAAFSDVTTGNNGFPAAVGYDLVTGLGSPKAEPLLKILTGY